MIDDLLAAITDLFDNDTTLMTLAALALVGSALLMLVMRMVGARTDVQRRVSGTDSEQAAAASQKPESAPLKGRVSSLIGALANTVVQPDSSQTRVLRTRMIQAGIYDRRALLWFFMFRVIGGLVFAAVACAVAWYFEPEMGYAKLAMFALVGTGLGFVAPSIALDKRINRLKGEHTSGFPDFMDLMVVCAQAGLSMEAAINRIAGEIGAAFPSLARNLELTAAEIRSGKPLSKAIESLALRLGIAEASSFATLLQQSEELGSSLTHSLRTYSDDMRNKRLMKAEEKAYALPAKLVVPLTLFVFPVLLVVLMLPVVISVSGANL